MAGLLAWEWALAAASAAGLALVGGLLLAVRPRRTATAAFALFLLLWAGAVLFGNLAQLAFADGDLDRAQWFLMTHLAFLSVLYVPLAYFTATYPSRTGFVATRWWGVALLVLPAAVAAAALALRPSLLHEGFAASPAGGRSVWGPLYPVLPILFFGALYHAMLRLHRHHQEAITAIEARRTGLVVAALGVYVAFISLENLVIYASTLASGALADERGQAAVFAVVSVAGCAVAGRVAWGLWRVRAPDRAVGRRVLTFTFLVPAALGVASGSSVSTTLMTVPFQLVGGVRFVSGALLAWAVLRYDLFDLDARVKRALVATGSVGVAAGVAVVLLAGATAALGSTGAGPVVAAALLGGALGVALLRAEPVAARLDALVLPSVGTPVHTESRRLEVYEAMLARAAAEGALDTEEFRHVRLRLGISEREHDLLVLLMRPGGSREGAPDPRPGAVVVERYEVAEELGRGSFGRAFLARDLALDRRVVLKVLAEPRLPRADAVRAFLAEARIAARLEHPNVVRVYDFGYVGDAPFLVMEHAEGGPLADRLGKDGLLPADEAVRVMLGVLSALAYVHARGYLHRDLKPQNVFLGADGEAKVADFGLAVASGAAGGPGGFGGGTPATMSPEALEGRPLTHASDVYCAGALLYQLVTGTTYAEFGGRSEDEVRRAILYEPPRPPPAGADRELVAVWTRALEKDPGRRYATAEEMRRALAGWRPAFTPRGRRATIARRR